MKTLSVLLLALSLLTFSGSDEIDEARILSHVVDPNESTLKMYWLDENKEAIRSLKALKNHTKNEGQNLLFAMNGGMYQEDRRPLGLYIEEGETLYKMNKTQDAYGNFYMQPNGVFYITENLSAGISESSDFDAVDHVHYATQSGPMLLIDGQIHPKFNKGSSNVHIRNAVGILPDGKVLFAMSKEKINFYDLASYFKQHGCQNALYLDGFVSRTYLPEKDWTQLGGNFGVMIAETGS